MLATIWLPQSISIPVSLTGTSRSRTKTLIGKSAPTFSTKSNSEFCKALSTVTLVKPRRNSSPLGSQRALTELALDQLPQSAVALPVGLQHGAPQIHQIVIDLLEVTYLVDVKVSESRSTASMSWYLVTAQKPEFGGASGVQCTGSSARRRVEHRPTLVTGKGIQIGEIDLIKCYGGGLRHVSLLIYRW